MAVQVPVCWSLVFSWPLLCVYLRVQFAICTLNSGLRWSSETGLLRRVGSGSVCTVIGAVNRNLANRDRKIRHIWQVCDT